MWNQGPKTFIAGEALSEHRLVKILPGTVTDPPEVVYADAGEDAIGATEAQADITAGVSVRLLGDGGTFELECLPGSSIVRGTVLYAGNDGMVTNVSSGSVIGVALEVGAANGHIEAAVDSRKSTTAAGTSIVDSASLIAGVTVEAALAELAAKVPTAITDPGNAGAIPVTKSGTCAITTAGAETRTLAIPTFAGQMIAISMAVDGGDGVITAASAINQTGNNTITLNDAGDTIVLIGVLRAAALCWRVMVNDGAALTTV